MVIPKRIPLFILLLAIGCSPSYVKRSAPVLDRLSREDYEEALSAVEGIKNEPFLYLVEKGTILHYAGRFDESNEAFSEAERLREDLIVPSISEGAVSLITSDAQRSYPGEDYEDLFINYFQILNYVFLDEYEEALVEARKVDVKLRALEDLYDGQLSHKNDAFMRYLTGVLYELEGNYNDAFIAYEASYRAYEGYEKLYGLEEPSFLGSHLVRTALWSGLDEKADRYRGVFPELEDSSFAWKGSGEVLFIFENGLLPHKKETKIDAPIPHGDGVYLFKMAFPKIEEQEARFSGAKLHVDGMATESWLAEDLQAIAIRNLKDRELRDVARAAARAALKYALTKKSEDLGEKLGGEKGDSVTTERSEVLGKLFGLVANLFGYATERADLRSWRSLPQNIQLSRLRVPVGSYDVSISLLGKGGRPLRTLRFPEVEVNEAEITFLRYRSY